MYNIMNEMAERKKKNLFFNLYSFLLTFPWAWSFLQKSRIVEKHIFNSETISYLFKITFSFLLFVWNMF